MAASRTYPFNTSTYSSTTQESQIIANTSTINTNVGDIQTLLTSISGSLAKFKFSSGASGSLFTIAGL